MIGEVVKSGYRETIFNVQIKRLGYITGGKSNNRCSAVTNNQANGLSIIIFSTTFCIQGYFLV